MGATNSDDNAIECSADAVERRVLILDDTLTTGATLQSVASALTRDGATVVGAVVVGRVIDLDDVAHFPHKHEIWARQSGIAFTFDACCLE